MCLSTVIGTWFVGSWGTHAFSQISGFMFNSGKTFLYRDLESVLFSKCKKIYKTAFCQFKGSILKVEIMLRSLNSQKLDSMQFSSVRWDYNWKILILTFQELFGRIFDEINTQASDMICGTSEFTVNMLSFFTYPFVHLLEKYLANGLRNTEEIRTA